MAQAIAYREIGAPEVLEIIDIPDVIGGPDEVVIAVQAAGVNPIDAKLRSGIRPTPAITSPRRVGADGAGEIIHVGSEVNGFRVGQSVAFIGAQGAYATHVPVPASQVFPLPAGVTPAQAAAIGIPAGTAYQALRSLAVGAGDVLLLHGGSGAVGQAAIQFAGLWGADVIATASPARFDEVRALGATPVEYGPGLEERVRSATPRPITVALDAAGTDEAIVTSLALVSDRSRIATLVRGADAPGFGIQAYSGGSARALSDDELRWRSEAVPVTLALLARGAFTVELGPSLPLAEAAEAHRLVESGTRGKIILRP
ncbi:NADP-dependent oxidoreductase [Microbacterium sp. C7(2022)]|uniref:quinone oxidoreductase family protein n=1 Tax=Microbacterium sp. C7(2022) TaxID=2992759 RepID=UPI00237B207D|nr:NADP-dependent oxidoreductase [Microbacterium sp. C7(2022)]MDE0545842.1 NADP-dependent oxidoreductase [Microbacterium sp. C7(2022)]